VHRRQIRIGGILAALLIVFYLLSPWVLGSLGACLVTEDVPRAADGVLVLAGDAFGNRILKGAELVERGLAPVVYVSGPAGMYGRTEDQLAIAFATERGHPASRFVGLPNQATSTLDEARMLLPILRSRGVRRLMLVTSNFHSARAARIFRRVDPGMEIVVVAAKDTFYSPDGWWHNRQGQKTFFFEVSKTLADAVGL
jgi:uncharacterized SAM-binding protein YcdF (DUF218 family)